MAIRCPSIYVLVLDTEEGLWHHSTMSHQAHILLVDDEPHILDVLEYVLLEHGFTVERQTDGDHAWTLFRAKVFDLVILDLNLPGLSGLDLFRRMRAEQPTFPVIMLTSRAEEVDRVLGLEMGADDYITKPFSPREVAARVRAVMRRIKQDHVPDPYQRVHWGPLTVDAASCTCSWRGHIFSLSRPECRLLERLVRYPARVFSRDELIDAIHGQDMAVTDRSIDTCVNRLRRKLEQEVPGLDLIESVYGVGYKARHLREEELP